MPGRADTLQVQAAVIALFGETLVGVLAYETGCFRFRLRSLVNVRRLRTFWTLGYFELDRVPFLQALVTLSRNGAVVHEHIRAIFPPNESVPLRVVKPLNRTFQTFHVRPLGTTFLRYVPPVEFILLL